jgi:hypothetical protein
MSKSTEYTNSLEGRRNLYGSLPGRRPDKLTSIMGELKIF